MEGRDQVPHGKRAEYFYGLFEIKTERFMQKKNHEFCASVMENQMFSHENNDRNFIEVNNL